MGDAVEIGIRELRDGLSRHLAEVRDGRTLTVTDHGRAIARIVPVGAPTRLQRLRDEGRVTQARRRKAAAPDPIEGSGIVSDLVADQRG